MDPISAMRDNNLSGMRDIPRSLGIVKVRETEDMNFHDQWTD